MNSDNSPQRLSKDEQYLLAYFDDLFERSLKSSNPVFSGFLSEREQAIALMVIKQRKEKSFSFFGGYDNAERVMLSNLNKDDFEQKDFPISLIKVNVKGATGLRHSDVLGSLMGTGIKREVIGDILISSGSEAFLFIENSFVAYLKSELIKIGKNFCEVEEVEFNKSILPRQQTEEISVVITSARLDCFVAAVLRLAREKAGIEIKSGKVFQNQEQVFNTSGKIKQGDKISIRGYGKYKIEDMSLTKKDRLRLRIAKYL